MKKIYLIFIGLLIIISAKAQKNFPLPSDNPFWTEVHSTLWTCGTSGSHGDCSGYACQCTKPVYYKSDTTINNINYNRLYARGICYGVYPHGMPPDGCPYSFNYENPEALFATIRQDTLNKMVYILDNGTEKTLYDFGHIIVGNKYPETYNNFNYQNDTLVVVALDSLLLGDIYVKKWNLGMKHFGIISDSAFVSIIEGIGSTFGILAPLAPQFENGDYLSCFSMNNIVLYPDSNYNCDKTVQVDELSDNRAFSMYPNPAFNILTIETSVSREKGFLRIITITGLEILKKEIKDRITNIDLSSFAKGVYFVQYIDGNNIETNKFIKD